MAICSQIDNSSFPSTSKFIFSGIKYRTQNEKLVPYVEMGFENIKKQLIKEIWIGPKSEMEIKDIINFLNYCGYYEMGMEINSEKPILVKKSLISYR